MKKIFFILVLAILIIPLGAWAAIRQDQNFSFGKNDVANKNLYAGGGNVNILGEAKQDLIVGGGTIIVSGTIGQDLAAAGGNLMIDGIIGDDARIAGGNLSIGGKIGGELLAAGGQVSLNSGLEVKGNTTLAGGSLLIDGALAGDLAAYGGSVRIDGKIAGNVKVETSQKLIIGSQAVISGSLDYKAPEKLTIEDGAKINGKVTFNEIQAQQAKKGLWGIWWLAWLVGLAIFLTAALVVYFLFRKKLEEAVSYTLANFGKETLRGFIILVVLPIAAIVAFVTVIGALLGGAGLLLYILMGVFTSIFAPMVFGTLIFRLILKKPDFVGDWRSVVTGVVALRIIHVIPYVGWIFWFIFFLAAFGALFNYLYRHFRKA
jgi:cytoskeletal protein CcmA (bactofilin family)